MKRTTKYLSGILAAVAVSAPGACTRISVTPSCPATVEVGEKVALQGNPREPGAIPTYLWEVFPVGAGLFVDAASVDTDFQGSVEGEATIRFTASDGLFQVVDECRVLVTSSTLVAVSLTVDPAAVVVGQAARIVCTSVGAGGEAVVRTIRQTEGTTVALTTSSEGVAVFTPSDEGELTFECLGQAADGRSSQPTLLTFSVEPDDDGQDDSSRPPSRSGR